MAKKKCDKNEIIVRYGWVEEVGNYCLFEDNKLVEPIQQLQVRHLNIIKRKLICLNFLLNFLLILSFLIYNYLNCFL